MLAAALVAMSSGPTAIAQGRGDGKAEARVLLLEGNARLDAGDAAGALAKYRAAYERFASPKLLLNIGTALRRLDRNVEAARTLGSTSP